MDGHSRHDDNDKSNTSNILLGQQLRDFSQMYHNHLGMQTNHVNDYKKLDEDGSIMSLMHTSQIVDDFLCEMNNFQQVENQNCSEFLSRQGQPYSNFQQQPYKSNDHSYFQPDQVIPEENYQDNSPNPIQKSFIRLFNELEDNAGTT